MARLKDSHQDFSEKLKAGTRVRHKLYGEGVVMEFVNDYEVYVKYDEQGKSNKNVFDFDALELYIL